MFQVATRTLDQSFILFSFYVYLLVSLLWLVYIVKPLYYFSSVLKSTSFTPNSFLQSFLSIPDLSSPSEIRTFRCYEGTAHKLRPSPFGIHLRSPESVILLPEPNNGIQSTFASAGNCGSRWHYGGDRTQALRGGNGYPTVLKYLLGSVDSFSK
jgi:hypothetical protein